MEFFQRVCEPSGFTVSEGDSLSFQFRFLLKLRRDLKDQFFLVVSMACFAFLGGQFQQDVFHLRCLWREEYGTLPWNGLREDRVFHFGNTLW